MLKSAKSDNLAKLETAMVCHDFSLFEKQLAIPAVKSEIINKKYNLLAFFLANYKIEYQFEPHLFLNKLKNENLILPQHYPEIKNNLLQAFYYINNSFLFKVKLTKNQKYFFQEIFTMLPAQLKDNFFIYSLLNAGAYFLVDLIPDKKKIIDCFVNHRSSLRTTRYRVISIVKLFKSLPLDQIDDQEIVWLLSQGKILFNYAKYLIKKKLTQPTKIYLSASLWQALLHNDFCLDLVDVFFEKIKKEQLLASFQINQHPLLYSLFLIDNHANFLALRKNEDIFLIKVFNAYQQIADIDWQDFYQQSQKVIQSPQRLSFIEKLFIDHNLPSQHQFKKTKI